ncbi:MAG: recombinase family protein [Oscillospiraceae bacterium]|nr:recombinase family protein [Oscillospiraceae bacterium]
MKKYERLNQERQIVEKKKRVAAYCRVSTDKDDQANSFESQQKYFREYIERMPDWELYEVFADEGISGTNTKKRKGFNRMISCAKSGDFDLIITKEISRFARNTLDSIYYTRDLKKRGVGVIFLSDNINTLDPDAELRLTIMSSIAQEESRKTSERVKWGQKRRMEQGVVFGRDMLGYDVRNGQMFINEDGAKIVRLVFQKFVQEGKGSHTIARELREAGYKTITGNAMWSNTVIYKILRNEKYCGDLVQKKTITPDYLSHEKKYNNGEEEFVILKDHHEAIVSREIFDEANRILDERSSSPESKTKHSNRYCFSGKIRCGRCNRLFVARYTKRKDGSTYKAWRCLEGTRHGKPRIDKAGNHVGCSCESIRNEDALQIMYLVSNSLETDKKAIVKNMIKVIESVALSDMAEVDTESLRESVRKAEEKKSRLLELYIGKNIRREEFIAVRTKCDEEIDALERMVNSIEKKDTVIRQQHELIWDITSAVNEIVDGMTLEEEFYRSLLDRMVVHNRENIDVYLNLLPHRWGYTVSQALEARTVTEIAAQLAEENNSEEVRHFSTRHRDRGIRSPGNGRHTCLSIDPGSKG